MDEDKKVTATNCMIIHVVESTKQQVLDYFKQLETLHLSNLQLLFERSFYGNSDPRREDVDIERLEVQKARGIVCREILKDLAQLDSSISSREMAEFKFQVTMYRNQKKMLARKLN